MPEHFVVEGSTLWIGEREFDLEAIESMMLALITFVLKILASFAILSLLGGVF